MKEFLVLMVKGGFLAVANLVPGVSGGTIAIVMGIYDKIINIINNVFKDFKNNILFLLPIGCGGVISILLFSGFISYSLSNYTFITIMFFVGLIIGGIPLLYSQVKGKESSSNWLILIVSYIIIMYLAFGFGEGSFNVTLVDLNLIDYVKLFLSGVIAGATMIIPGVSGSLVLMLLGYYESLMNVIGNLTDFSLLGNNLAILMPFGIGVVLGIWLISKIIIVLFEKFKDKSYFMIIGFVIASVTIIIGKNNVAVTLLDLCIGLVLAIIGLIVSFKLSKTKKD